VTGRSGWLRSLTRVNSTQPRGPDWANAAARLGIALGVPILASILVKVLGAQTDAGALLFVLWMLALLLGPAWAWEAWQASVADPTLRVSDDQIAGRTGWPLRRWRSVRLDQLARVRYYKSIERTGMHNYIVVRDLAGGRVTVEFPSSFPWPQRLRDALLSAIDNSPSARVGYVTRRRLAGANPWWTVPLWILEFTLFIVVVAAVAVMIWLPFGAVE
jgi:hypothetical protein